MRGADRFELLLEGNVAALVNEPVRADALRHLGGEPNGLEQAGEWVFSRGWLEELRADLRARIEAADPLDPGIPAPSEPWARDILPLTGVERRGARLYLPGSVASLGERAGAAASLEAQLAAAGFTPIQVEDRELAAFLEREGRLVRLGDGLAVGAEAYEEARGLLLYRMRERRLDHPRPLPRSARHWTQAGPAPPRALRRRRAHPAHRRRARAPAPGQDRLSYVSRGAARARWPSWSSKPVRRGSPTLGRFDSCAAPFPSIWLYKGSHGDRTSSVSGTMECRPSPLTTATEGCSLSRTCRKSWRWSAYLLRCARRRSPARLRPWEPARAAGPARLLTRLQIGRFPSAVYAPVYADPERPRQRRGRP